MLAVTAVADKLYALGGVPRGFTTAEATLQQYNPDTDSWVLLPDMPFTRANHMAASVNGRIYVIGGRDGFIGSTSAPPSTVYEFDPRSGTWANRAGLPDPRVFLAGGALGKTIFAISGALGVVNPHPGVASVTEFQP
jgi:N-acetylneuraminic acid mutarotase